MCCIVDEMFVLHYLVVHAHFMSNLLSYVCSLSLFHMEYEAVTFMKLKDLFIKHYVGQVSVQPLIILIRL